MWRKITPYLRAGYFTSMSHLNYLRVKLENVFIFEVPLRKFSKTILYVIKIFNSVFNGCYMQMLTFISRDIEYVDV